METVVFAIVPDGEAYEALKNHMHDLSERVGSRKALQFPPHITILGRFQTEQYESLLLDAQNALNGEAPFFVTLERIEHFTAPPLLFFAVKNDEYLRVLHEKLLPIVEKYRTALVRETLLAMAKSDQQRDYINRYGSPFVREYYVPHLTLAGPDVDETAFNDVAPSAFADPVMVRVGSVAVLRKDGYRWRVDRRLYFSKR